MPRILIPSIKRVLPAQSKGLLAACGLALALSAPGFGLWMLAWTALIPALAWCFRQERRGEAIAGGMIVGACFHGLSFAWFWNLHPVTWLGFTEWASLLVTGAGWLLLVAEGAVLMGALFGLLHWLSREGHPRWLAVVAFPLLWVGVFSLQGWTPMALPWALLEYTQMPVPLLRELTGTIGGSGLTVLLLLHNTLWAALLSKGASFSPVKSLACLFVPIFLWLSTFIPVPMPEESSWPVPVAVVQGNIPIETVRSTDLTPAVIEKAYIEPVLKAQLPPGTLIILPEEGAMDDWVDVAHPDDNLMTRYWQSIAREKQVSIAIGVSAYEQRPERENHYNSLMLVRKNGFEFYYKRRLVPFGEYTPYLPEKWLTETLARFQVNYANSYQAGVAASLLTLPSRPNPVRLGGLVCFELIDPAFSTAYRKLGADLLVNVSNLGWFHGNRQMEAQFIAIGQLRAAENRLPLVIANNTGLSAIISARGEILRQTPERAEKTRSHKPDLIFYNGSRY